MGFNRHRGYHPWKNSKTATGIRGMLGVLILIVGVIVAGTLGVLMFVDPAWVPDIVDRLWLPGFVGSVAAILLGVWLKYPWAIRVGRDLHSID